MTQKYILLHDVRSDLKAGTTVYQCGFHDYGLARDDTNHTGIEHKSVTLDPTGDYPFFTAPVHSLQKVD
jgi:hypothetical protein